MELGRCLRRLHDELIGFLGELGGLNDVREDIGRLYGLLRPTAEVSAQTIESLGERLGALDDVVFRASLPTQALHGDASITNLPRTPQGLIWNDFEDTFRGPVHWDLASLVSDLQAHGADGRAVRRFLDTYGWGRRRSSRRSSMRKTFITRFGTYIAVSAGVRPSRHGTLTSNAGITSLSPCYPVGDTVPLDDPSTGGLTIERSREVDAPRSARVALRLAPWVIIGAVVLALAGGGIPATLSLLSQAAREPVSATTGVDYCFGEPWPDNPHGAGMARLPFVRWLKSRMGAHAVYALDYTPPPDTGCLTLGLLPALPARPGERAEWTIAFGSVPAEMRALIGRHDPAVEVFAPGFALQFNGRL